MLFWRQKMVIFFRCVCSLFFFRGFLAFSGCLNPLCLCSPWSWRFTAKVKLRIWRITFVRHVTKPPVLPSYNIILCGRIRSIVHTSCNKRIKTKTPAARTNCPEFAHFKSFARFHMKDNLFVFQYAHCEASVLLTTQYLLGTGLALLPIFNATLFVLYGVSHLTWNCDFLRRKIGGNFLHCFRLHLFSLSFIFLVNFCVIKHCIYIYIYIYILSIEKFQ